MFDFPANPDAHKLHSDSSRTPELFHLCFLLHRPWWAQREGRWRAAPALLSQANPEHTREPQGSSHRGGDGVGAQPPALQPGGTLYHLYCFLTMDRLKPAVAIFRMMISINSGSRLLAAKIDETTAGASARARDGGTAAACGARSPRLPAARGRGEPGALQPEPIESPAPPWAAPCPPSPQLLHDPL